MTLRYEKILKEVYLEDSDETETEVIEFDYEVSDEQLKQALLVLVDEYYFNCKASLKDLKGFIRDCDIWDILEEMFEDELKEYFEKEAFEYFESRY